MKRTVRVPMLARVEGEGSLHIQIDGDRVADVKLGVFEPPRLFEAFMRGRHCTEAPDITARICGICPVAYQMSAVHALERALGIAVSPSLRELRRLLYCAEWIESHALHIYLLQAPDLLGYPDALAMARDYGEPVRKGLALKKAGNDLMILLGGREIHPVSVCLGGFYRVPTRHELGTQVDGLLRARDIAIETVTWLHTLAYPEFEYDYEFVSLRHKSEYPLNEGNIVSNRGLDIDPSEFAEHFHEVHAQHSNALQCVIRERGAYMVGPLARFNLNFDRLPAEIRQMAVDAGLRPPCRNPFLGALVRAVETVWACEEALRIIREYERPHFARTDYMLRAGVGHAATEAPRGTLYHRYEIDAEGAIMSVRIVPPTAQNQRQVEEDLRRMVPTLLDLPNEELTARCEHAVRNYDPCISCATHALRVTVSRK